MMNDQSMFDPGYYNIKVKGRLDSEWSNWFEGMTISYMENVIRNLEPYPDLDKLI